MMVRSFLPVGQGAFYSECFDEIYPDRNLNVVYDCGAYPGINNVKREIENQFDKGEIIDAVFISHLDADHINGLPYLLEYCEVKKIYFPLILSKNKILLKIKFEITGVEGFVRDFLEDPRRTIRELGIDYEVELIGVREGEAGDFRRPEERFEREEERGGEDIIIDSGRDVFDHIKRSSHSGSIHGFEWKYVPYNFEQRSRKEQLMRALEHKFGRSVSEDEVEKIWRDGSSYGRKIIKEAYKCVRDDLNTNSMTVFSGTTDVGGGQTIMPGCSMYDRFCGWRRRYFSSGCLYTGDYDASDWCKCSSLKNAYSEYWKHIGCMQVPHHGSKHNFNKEILKEDAFYIISAGFSNKFGHPASSVIKKIFLNNTIPFVVTEKTGSGIYIVVNW